MIDTLFRSNLNSSKKLSRSTLETILRSKGIEFDNSEIDSFFNYATRNESLDEISELQFYSNVHAFDLVQDNEIVVKIRESMGMDEEVIKRI